MSMLHAHAHAHFWRARMCALVRRGPRAAHAHARWEPLHNAQRAPAHNATSPPPTYRAVNYANNAAACGFVSTIESQLKNLPAPTCKTKSKKGYGTQAPLPTQALDGARARVQASTRAYASLAQVAHMHAHACAARACAQQHTPQKQVDPRTACGLLVLLPATTHATCARTRADGCPAT